VIALVVSAIATQPLDAQRTPDGRRSRIQSREQLEQRIRAQMGRLMRERLGLSDEQAVALGEIVESFEGRRRDLFRQEQETRRRTAQLTSQSAPDPEEAQALLERMVSLRAREAALFGEEQEALLEVLTPVQILELHALRAEIGQRIRALRSGRSGERRRGGPLPAGGVGGAFMPGSTSFWLSIG
jgi:Spy/CpxP family protein refolding chaperone